MPDIESLDQPDRYFAPRLNYAGEEHGGVRIKTGVKPYRKQGSRAASGEVDQRQTCMFGRGEELISNDLVYVEAEKTEELVKIDSQNPAQTEHFADARKPIACF